MTWGLTSRGRVVHFDQPMVYAPHISIKEIAHSLANINRFHGHALRPVSVAEHSLLVCDIVARDMHLGVHAQLLALLHDAHECVTTDLASPAKQVVGAAWAEFEAGWELAFHAAFALRLAADAYGPAIKRADLIALATERRDLLPAGGPAWPTLAGVEPVQGINLRDRDKFTWVDWRTAFEDRYAELDFARNTLYHRRPI